MLLWKRIGMSASVRCSGVQRGSTCALVALMPARARARDDNYHALPSTSNLWRSTRATASLLWGKKKQESGVRRAKGDAERENKNAPVLTSRHNTPRIYVYSPCTRSLYRHDDFTNIRLHPGPLFLLGLTSPPPTVSLPFSLRALCNANLAQ